MKLSDLTGRSFTVIEASTTRILVELDRYDGMETNRFTLIQPRFDGEGTDAYLEAEELKTK